MHCHRHQNKAVPTGLGFAWYPPVGGHSRELAVAPGPSLTPHPPPPHYKQLHTPSPLTTTAQRSAAPPYPPPSHAHTLYLKHQHHLHRTDNTAPAAHTAQRQTLSAPTMCLLQQQAVAGSSRQTLSAPTHHDDYTPTMTTHP